jgi:hypothetical protein
MTVLAKNLKNMLVMARIRCRHNCNFKLRVPAAVYLLIAAFLCINSTASGQKEWRGCNFFYCSYEDTTVFVSCEIIELRDSSMTVVFFDAAVTELDYSTIYKLRISERFSKTKYSPQIPVTPAANSPAIDFTNNSHTPENGNKKKLKARTTTYLIKGHVPAVQQLWPKLQSCIDKNENAGN